MTEPRGIRNRNPLNIEFIEEDHLRDPWIGIADPPSDGRYCVYIHPIYGLRAGLRTMESYKRRGLQTLEEVIREWAPPEDHNATAQYIQVVSNLSGAARNEYVLRSPKIREILAGMTRFENGQQPYPRMFFDAAVELWTHERPTWQ